MHCCHCSKWFKNIWYEKRSIALELISKLASYQEIVQMTPSPIIPHTSGALNKIPRKQCGCILFLVDNVSPPIRLLIFASRLLPPIWTSLRQPQLELVFLFVCNFAKIGVWMSELNRSLRIEEATALSRCFPSLCQKTRKTFNSRSIVNEARLRLFIAFAFHWQSQKRRRPAAARLRSVFLNRCLNTRWFGFSFSEMGQKRRSRTKTKSEGVSLLLRPGP